MLFPYRALRLIPETVSITNVLDRPIVQTIPVVDDVGVQYANDLVLTDGFYVTIATYIALRYVLRQLAEWRR